MSLNSVCFLVVMIIIIIFYLKYVVDLVGHVVLWNAMLDHLTMVFIYFALRLASLGFRTCSGHQSDLK